MITQAHVSDAPWFGVPQVEAATDDSVQVWVIQIDASHGDMEVLESTLSSDEKTRANRFHFAVDRQRYVISHGALRSILGGHLGIPADQLSFARGPNGKPALAYASTGLRFNLSHSGNFALIALTQGREIGVDIEQIRLDFETDRIAERCLSLREKSMLRQLPEADRAPLFHRFWTCKEAYMKATGLGLSMSPQTFEVALAHSSAMARVIVPHSPEEFSRWRIRELQVAPGYAAALAVEGSDWDVRCANWSLPSW